MCYQAQRYRFEHSVNLFLSAHLSSKQCKNFKASHIVRNLSDIDRQYNTFLALYLAVISKSSLTGATAMLEGLTFLKTPNFMSQNLVNQVTRPTATSMIASMSDLLIQRGVREKAGNCKFGIILGLGGQCDFDAHFQRTF